MVAGREIGAGRRLAVLREEGRASGVHPAPPDEPVQHSDLDHRPPRALVTGAAGFIGSALTAELLRHGWEVLGIDDFSGGWPERLPDATAPRFEFVRGDVAEPGLLRELLASGGGRCTAVVHLAARVGVRAVLADPEGCRVQNLAGVRAVVSAIESLPAGVRPRLFAASTSEVYAPSSSPVAEGAPLRARDGAGRWAYAASKLVGEDHLEALAGAEPAGGGPVHLRFFNVVGPGQDADSGMVLPTFVERALAGAAIPIHGDGTQVRTFAHVDRVARCLRELLELPHVPRGALNVGGRARTSIGALARLVRELAGSRSPLERCDPRRSVGRTFEAVHFREPDLGRLASLGVPVPDDTLEEIVRDTLARHGALARPRGRIEGGEELLRCASPAC